MGRARGLVGLALVACAGGSPATPEDGGATDVATDAGAPQRLTLHGVALDQAVEVALLRDGAPVETRNAPIIPGREAHVVLTFKIAPGWVSKTVRAKLLLDDGRGKVTEWTAARTLSISSTTMELDVDKAVLTATTTWAVELSAGDTLLARHPAEGSEPLGAKGAGRLSVRVIPIRYKADGSDRLPDTSATALDNLQSRLYALYPATGVDLSLHAPIDWAGAITADGGGWSELLDAIHALRASEAPPKTVYYYGLFVPATSYGKYCPKGCLIGLSLRPADPRDAASRVSIGIGYADDLSASTMAHEIGHAHGRLHAPCGSPAGIDPKYPYAGGTNGVPGWDVLARAPYLASSFDIMGYCDPGWISDYTYSALYDRMAFVNGVASEIGSGPRAYRRLEKSPGGGLRLGPRLVLQEPARGEPRDVVVVRDGVEQHLAGYGVPYSHLPGELVLVEDPGPSAAGLPARVATSP